MILKDFKYPFLEQYKGISYTELARQKLLTGRCIVKFNSSISIEVDNTDTPHLLYPSFNVFSGIIDEGTIELNFFNSSTVTLCKKSDFLYMILGCNVYFIVVDSKVMAIFSFFRTSELKFTKISESRGYFYFEVTDLGSRERYELRFSKSDYSYSFKRIRGIQYEY